MYWFWSTQEPNASALFTNFTLLPPDFHIIVKHSSNIHFCRNGLIPQEIQVFVDLILRATGSRSQSNSSIGETMA